MTSKVSWFRCIQAGALLAAALSSLSCGPKLMRETTPDKGLEEGKALVTFVRATWYGGNIPFELWDRESFVGLIEWKQYIQAAVPPGEHVFLCKADNWSYVKATLEAGRKYFVLVNVSLQNGKAIARLKAVTKDQSEWGQAEIDYWLANLTPVTPIPEALPPFVAERLPEIRQAFPQGELADIQAEELSADDHWE